MVEDGFYRDWRMKRALLLNPAVDVLVPCVCDEDRERWESVWKEGVVGQGVEVT